jgi:ABC-type Fe3+-siderophore transport system permease subunit
MQVPRYVVGAFLFGLIWAVISYTNGNIRDLEKLSILVILFGVLGSVLSWALSKALNWFNNRN